MINDLKNAILNLQLDNNALLFNGDNNVILSHNVMYHICGDKIKEINLVDNELYESPYYSYIFIEAIQWNYISNIYATNDACITINEIEYPISIRKNGIFIHDSKNDAKVLALALNKDPLELDNFIIGPQAFKYTKEINTIAISTDTIKFDIQAFSEISTVESIDLSKSSLSNIPWEMFEEDISLKYVLLPSSISSIGKRAFYGCTSLSSIEIPSTTTNLGYQCFGDCSNLISIEIPNCITSFDEGYIFENCQNLSIIKCHSQILLDTYCYQMNNSLSIYVDEQNHQLYIDDLTNNGYGNLSSNIFSIKTIK